MAFVLGLLSCTRCWLSGSPPGADWLVLLVCLFVGVDGSVDGNGDGAASCARKLRGLDGALVERWWTCFVVDEGEPRPPED
jgi:hypothetical protein